MTQKIAKPLIVLNALHTESGGGAVYLQSILAELAKDSRFMFRVVMTEKGAGLVSVPDGVDVRILPRFRFGLSHVVEQILMPILAYFWRASAVWSNANYGPILAPKAMVTLHTTPRAAAVWPGIYWKIYWFIWWWLTVVCLMRAPRFFAVAKHVIADFTPWWWPSIGQKGAVVYPSVTAPVFHGEKKPMQIISVGDFYRHKRYLELIHAFGALHRNLPEARLLIVGRPQFDGVYEEVLAEVDRLKLTEKVTIVPGLPHAQTMQKVAESACYVSSSAAECFNMPVLEAMTLGVPVVLPDMEFQREVAGDAALYVNYARDGAEGLAVAMAQVLSDETLAHRLHQQGLIRAELFDWQTSAAVMRETFAEVCGIKAV